MTTNAAWRLPRSHSDKSRRCARRLRRAITKSGTRYATGYNPSLNQTINEILARNDNLTEEDLERIYSTYLSPARITDRIDTVGSRVADEIGQVMAMIDAAAGSASNYSESLVGMSQKISNAKDREGLRTIVESLVQTTNEMQQTNNSLEQKLTASKQEINQLQENLEVVRTESLTDPMTGLANRKFFDDTLAKRDLGRHGAQRTAVIADGRYRPLQDLQRHLRPPDRRSGVAPCRIIAEAECKGPGRRRALWR